MFDSGELVWHDKYGRGTVAFSSGPITYVMWDDMSQNDLATTEVPTTTNAKGKVVAAGPSELEGHYIYVDEAAVHFAHEQQQKIKSVPMKETGEQPFLPELFEPGWFKVVKVNPKMIPRWNAALNMWEMKPQKGHNVLSLDSVETDGEKFRNFVTNEEAFHIPGKYATDVLYSVMEGGFGQESEGLEDQE